MNIRHVSIFNEFSLIVSGSKISVLKNLGTVSLNPSKIYGIKNLSVDIGASILSTDILDIYGKFPLRFFLSNDPLFDEYNRIKNVYPSSLIKYNNVLQTTNQFSDLPISNDIIDSSNSDFLNSIFYNIFEIYDIPAAANINYFLNLAKCETISEFNFFSINYFKFAAGTTTAGLVATNNDISDFSFFSNSNRYLNFSIYPGLNGSGSPPSGSFRYNYTVNFDLEEF